LLFLLALNRTNYKQENWNFPNPQPKYEN